MTVDSSTSTTLWPRGIAPASLLLMLALLASSIFYDYLLFHTLAELFAVMVAVLVGVVGWQTYPFSRNHFLMFLAAGYLWVGALDLLHTLAYSGVDVLPSEGGNTATQFWLAARWVEAMILVMAPRFVERRAPRGIAFAMFGGIFLALSVLVLSGHFPAAFIPGEGLTPFKIINEYLIIVVLTIALLHLYRKRTHLDNRVWALMMTSIALTIFSEYLFTLYYSVYGIENFLGHLGKLVSYWLIFVSIVNTTLTQPFRVMARGATTYEAVPDPTVLVGRDGIIHQANRAARGVAGDREVVGRHCHELFHPPEREVADCPVCRAIHAGPTELQTFELGFARADRCALVSVSPVGAGGADSGVVHVSRDITQRMRAERALRKANEELASILHSVGEGVYGIDAQGRATFVNPTLERLTGWRASELIGHDIHTAIHRHDGDCAIHKTAVDGVTRSREDTFWRKDDSSFPVEYTAAPLHNTDGKSTGAVVVFRDVTERRRSQEALLASEQRYRALMENTSDAILITDAEGYFIDVNGQAESLLGYSKEELSTLRPPDIHPPEQHAAVAAAFEAMDTTGHALTEHDVLRKDGTRHPVEVAGTRVAFGGKVYYVGTFRDISERRRSEAERQRYRGELERTVAERTRDLQELNRELESFSYSVSHDLRGPLRAVNGFAHALSDEFGSRLGPKGEDYLRRMRDASVRMGQMIDGLLVLSRVVRREIAPEMVDLSAVARQVADETAQSDPARQVTWQITPGLKACGDPALLRLLLQNLLQNAWKFTAAEAGAVIEVGEVEAGTFFVRDNGIGFDDSDADALFQPFYRLNGVRYEGTGIGLATVQRIIGRHGGRCWAEGRPGTGATFYFALPGQCDERLSSNI